MKPEITKNESKLTILSFSCPKGTVAETILDLAAHAGEYLRIWLDDDLTYSLDKHANHYWQIAELQMPHQTYVNIDTGEVDEQGLPVTVSEPVPIELPTVRLFDIEKGE